MNTGGSQSVSFIASMVIARIAVPSDFGLIAIGGSIILLCNVLAESGFASTIVYDDEFSEEKASTILWLSVTLGFLLFLLVWYFSDVISYFFDKPQLKVILPVMAFSIIGTSFGVTHAALITRNLQFDKNSF